jgi:thioredoxin-dependent peroxiredoxin
LQAALPAKEESEMTTKLTQGDPAPEFSLADQNNRTVTLKSFKGRKLLLYFYPKANTPGCTKQSCAVSEAMPRLKELTIDAVGISPDKPEAQRKFDEKYNLGFSLLSDPDLETARAFGAFGVKNMFGKKKEGIVRSCFLIDEEGRILAAWYKVKPEDTVPKALEALR